jgi:pimeloyl-ACP methyl ester carboxylesterase
MPALVRPDGVEIHWETRGEGPLVFLAPYWSGHPGVFEVLLNDLATDHRVITYDARGTGGSTRQGPFDIETDAEDLAAVVAEVGGSAVALTIANGANVAVRVAARSPELIAQLVCFGTAPIARNSFEGTDEGMIASDSVVDAFLEMIARDYRGAMRSLLTATNPQMTEEELRERVRFQTEYCPSKPALGRLRAWTDDDPNGPAREVGERLTILTSADVAGQWLPDEERLARITARLVPDAHVERVEDGAVSRPDLAAAVIRRLTAPMRTAAGIDARSS